jgi:hypothetical protein
MSMLMGIDAAGSEEKGMEHRAVCEEAKGKSGLQ